MKLKGKLIFLALVFFGFNSKAQILSTKEVKIILVVNEKSNTVGHIELFNSFKRMNNSEVLEKYPNCHFYIGLLEGSYELNNNSIIPTADSKITMYADRRYLSSTILFPIDDILVGEQLNLGKVKAKVISKKKGELVLKAI